MFLDHTRRHTTVGRTPLDEWSARCRDFYLTGRGLCDELITRPEESYRLWCVVVCDLETSRIGAPYIYIYMEHIYDISSLRVKLSYVWLMCFYFYRYSSFFISTCISQLAIYLFPSINLDRRHHVLYIASKQKYHWIISILNSLDIFPHHGFWFRGNLAKNFCTQI